MSAPRRARRAPGRIGLGGAAALRAVDPPDPGAAPARPPKKPMAMTRRVSLFDREVSVRLAPVALDLLHGAARVLTEGELTADGYAGSTMLTVDLARTADRISDPPDDATARRVALLYAADERCRERARRVALAEAARVAGCALAAPRVDVESRARGPALHLSVNVEAQRRTTP